VYRFQLFVSLLIVSVSANAVIKSNANNTSTSNLTHAESLIQSLHDARQLAEQSQTNVVFCASNVTSGEISGCEDSDDWSQGWIMYVDNFPLGEFNPLNDRLVKSSSPQSTAEIHIKGLNHRIRFNIDGSLLSSGVQSLQVCEAISNDGYEVVVPIVGQSSKKLVERCDF